MDPGLWRTVKVVFGRLFVTPRGIRPEVRSDQGSERQAPLLQLGPAQGLALGLSSDLGYLGLYVVRSGLHTGRGCPGPSVPSLESSFPRRHSPAISAPENAGYDPFEVQSTA